MCTLACVSSKKKKNEKCTLLDDLLFDFCLAIFYYCVCGCVCVWICRDLYLIFI